MRLIGGNDFLKHDCYPLFLESGWLLIGHVDEFVQFLPSNETGLGFTIGIADTTSALDLLRNTSAAGHGSVRAISFNGSVEGSSSITKEELTMTIDELLANETLHEVNAYAQRHIDANLGILLAEIPSLRDHVIRIPSLFKAPKVSSRSSFTETVMDGEYLLVSFSPGGYQRRRVGQLLHIILEVAIREADAKAGMEVGFVDDTMSHHHTFGVSSREGKAIWCVSIPFPTLPRPSTANGQRVADHDVKLTHHTGCIIASTFAAIAGSIGGVAGGLFGTVAVPFCS
ncbi:Putative protein-arginine deiminase [Colletotrichum destructivum]|uniref:Protein-arginine deiminase C-terminal domain-containing protein n=1 Tax=Colletotrichum destructivum TaxID=34406 RepID=A0AAX4HWL2_9PEZI|nr:Putative protein-arginine deiminase [Colletotrichum destructivum]